MQQSRPDEDDLGVNRHHPQLTMTAAHMNHNQPYPQQQHQPLAQQQPHHNVPGAQVMGSFPPYNLTSYGQSQKYHALPPQGGQQLGGSGAGPSSSLMTGSSGTAKEPQQPLYGQSGQLNSFSGANTNKMSHQRDDQDERNWQARHQSRQQHLPQNLAEENTMKPAQFESTGMDSSASNVRGSSVSAQGSGNNAASVGGAPPQFSGQPPFTGSFPRTGTALLQQGQPFQPQLTASQPFVNPTSMWLHQPHSHQPPYHHATHYTPGSAYAHGQQSTSANGQQQQQQQQPPQQQVPQQHQVPQQQQQQQQQQHSNQYQRHHQPLQQRSPSSQGSSASLNQPLQSGTRPASNSTHSRSMQQQFQQQAPVGLYGSGQQQSNQAKGSQEHDGRSPSVQQPDQIADQHFPRRGASGSPLTRSQADSRNNVNSESRVRDQNSGESGSQHAELSSSAVASSAASTSAAGFSSSDSTLPQQLQRQSHDHPFQQAAQEHRGAGETHPSHMVPALGHGTSWPVDSWQQQQQSQPEHQQQQQQPQAQPQQHAFLASGGLGAAPGGVVYPWFNGAPPGTQLAGLPNFGIPGGIPAQQFPPHMMQHYGLPMHPYRYGAGMYPGGPPLTPANTALSPAQLAGGDSTPKAQDDGPARVESYRRDFENGATSLQVFESFVKVKTDANGKQEIDTTGVISRECYEAWVKSRKRSLDNPEEAFRKALVSYITVADGASRPFTPEVEASLLALLRKRQIWPCFKDRKYSQKQTPILIGSHGIRAKGYHEQRKLNGEAKADVDAERRNQRKKRKRPARESSEQEDGTARVASESEQQRLRRRQNKDGSLDGGSISPGDERGNVLGRGQSSSSSKGNSRGSQEYNASDRREK